ADGAGFAVGRNLHVDIHSWIHIPHYVPTRRSSDLTDAVHPRHGPAFADRRLWRGRERSGEHVPGADADRQPGGDLHRPDLIAESFERPQDRTPVSDRFAVGRNAHGDIQRWINIAGY